jgi:hypothetical protein
MAVSFEMKSETVQSNKRPTGGAGGVEVSFGFIEDE